MVDFSQTDSSVKLGSGVTGKDKEVTKMSENVHKKGIQRIIRHRTDLLKGRKVTVTSLKSEGNLGVFVYHSLYGLNNLHM